MSRIRKSHSADFKAQVALAAIREDATIAELSSSYGVHATVIHGWKKEAIAAMSSGFSGKQERQESDHTTQIKELHAKINPLIVERDFFSRCLQTVGLVRRQEMVEPANANVSII